MIVAYYSSIIWDFLASHSFLSYIMNYLIVPMNSSGLPGDRPHF